MSTSFSRKGVPWASLVIAGFIAVSLGAAAPLRAALYSWKVASGDWSAASNWGGTAPTINDVAYVSNGGTANITLLGETCGTLSLGNVASGTVRMTGGSISTPVENVGDSGAGVFVQSGGTNDVTSLLSVGNGYSGVGSYSLSGSGRLSSTLLGGSPSGECIGYSGSGSFTQSGGTNSVGNLYVAYNYGTGAASYAMNSGLLSVSHVAEVGSSGSGSFTQSGGSVSIFNSLYLGYNGYNLSGFNGTGNGSYQLGGAGSLLVSGTEYVGYGGYGTFTQTGGTNSIPIADGVGGTLFVGYVYSGTYVLSGTGLLMPYTVMVGGGEFNQTGGTLSTGNFYLGSNMNNSSTGSLGGGLFGAYSLTVGAFGNGVFTQSGGTSNIGDLLQLGYNTGVASMYNLNGGLLVIPALTEGAGTAVFDFSGGTLRAGGGFSTSVPLNLVGGAATIDTAGYTLTLAGSLSGPGSLSKINGGTLILATTNTYSGNTLIGGGTLALGSPLALQNSTLDTSGSGALRFGTLASATLGGLTGPGTLNLANSSSSAVALGVGNNNASTTFTGLLIGPGSLTKIGSGTLLLTGSDTYTGATTVSGGKLVVNGSLTNSAVTVQSGGTLGGTGKLSSVTVNSGGQLAPGDAPGLLTLTGSLSLLSGAKLDYELDTPIDSDEIFMPSGVLDLNGQQFTDFDFTPLGGFGEGTYDLVDAGSIIGSGLGADRSGVIDGLSASIAVQNNEVVLTVVPEPGTLALVAAGLLGMTGVVWRLNGNPGVTS